MTTKYGTVAGIMLSVLGAWVATAEVTPPSVQTILSAYAKANDRIQGFAVHYSEEYRTEAKTNHLSLPSGNCTSFKEGWCFHDFARQRSIFSRKVWGKQAVNAPPLSKDNAVFMQSRWADGVAHEYLSGDRTNYIMRSPVQTQRYAADPTLLMTSYFPGTEAIGYFNGDQRRIDKKLTGAYLSVRNGMERIGDLPCYVVEGRTRFGRITAWFAPAKGYALAKYTVDLTSNDISYDNLTLARAYKIDGTTQRWEIMIEKFTEANGVWLPVKANVSMQTSFPQGDFRKTSRTIQMDSWSINPDFEAIHAFELKEIPDDSIWQYADDYTRQYRWNGGNLTPVTKARQSNPTRR